MPLILLPVLQDFHHGAFFALQVESSLDETCGLKVESVVDL